MGREANFQAIPQDCELMIAARQDREIAEYMPHFQMEIPDTARLRPGIPPKWLEFNNLVKKLVSERPDVRDRYFYAGSRSYDAIVYLLSPERRAGHHYEDDTTLIYQAMYGQERLHPQAHAGQGHPIGVVLADGVKLIADYLDQVTFETLHEHYDPAQMQEAGVYKMWSDSGEGRFEAIWGEFEGMRQVYRAAANHDEAVITVID